MVGVQDPNNPGETPKKFQSILDEAGIKTKYTFWSQANSPEVFDLFVVT
jgi:hypothetical protein